jgi:prophage maintenance system killer protein
MKKMIILMIFILTIILSVNGIVVCANSDDLIEMDDPVVTLSDDIKFFGNWWRNKSKLVG